MASIDIKLSLKEAEILCIILTKSDPFGIFSGAVVKRIDDEAKKKIHEMMKEKEQTK